MNYKPTDIITEQISRAGGMDRGYIDTVQRGVISILHDHVLPSDPRRNATANLQLLRSRNGLLCDLKEKDNLLYEGKNWAIATTIGPYGNHHVMLIYTGESEEISHLGQVPDDHREEYYSILTKLLEGLQIEYNIEFLGGDLELFYGVNCSLQPGAGKSQSVYRPHTQVVCIDLKEKAEGLHVIKRKPLIDGTTNNKGMLALNKENLALIKEFESKFLSVGVQKYKEALIVTGDEYYAVDFALPGDMSDTSTIKMFEEVHDEGRHFLEAIQRGDRNRISGELFTVLGERIDKLGFSIGFYQEEGLWHLRFRFSLKNPGENAGVLEAMGHSITRDKNAPDELPNMSRIRKTVKKIF